MLNKQIKITTSRGNEKATLTVSENEITVQYGDQSISKKGEYPFMVLKEIREALDKKNIFLLVNGSRRDVYPSGLSLMGTNAYIQTFGKPCSLQDLVDIFDETDRIDMIGTVNEQLNYHKQWIESL